MLELKDFFHLPQVDPLIDQLAADRQGLVLIAGMDARPDGGVPDGMLSGGASTFLGLLARRLIAEHAKGKTVLVGQSKNAVRVPAALGNRIRSVLVKPPLSYADALAQAARAHPEMIIVDQLEPELAAVVLRLAQEGIRVLSRIDCIFAGSGVARHLAELGAPLELFDGLAWIITVQRVATLCPVCKTSVPEDARLAELAQRYPSLPAERSFAKSKGCASCHQTGRRGDVIAFDIFRARAREGSGQSGNLFEQPSLLSMEEYELHLAALGHISPDDIAEIDREQLFRTFRLLSASERALAEANTKLTSKLAELESAHRVLEQRTESLFLLQEIAHSLIASTELEDMARQICRSTRRLMGADRSILYVRDADETVEVAAVSGWEEKVVHVRLEASEVLGDAEHSAGDIDEPTPFRGFPPGIPARHPDVEGVELRAGLRVPLVAQSRLVGMMIVHSTRKTRFTAGEIALLKTLASQAAVAIQRAGLVHSLRDKIAELQAAQAELVNKERLERELELARGVQKSLLPSVFPKFEGYTFVARNEMARPVGGDFYDVIRVDEDHFGLVIADVSDKGMPAALYMALTRSLLFAEARRDLSPCSVLRNVHRLLRELGDPEMFVTVFYGVVDIRARTLTYCRAGHEQPLLLRGQEIEALQGKGTLLGSLNISEFLLSEEHLQLEHGDKLILYTDGLVDAVDAHEQPFGLARLTILLKENASATPEELCKIVFASLADYQETAEQFDDMALVIMNVQ